MTLERSQLIEFIRSEVVGPARRLGLPDDDKTLVTFDKDKKFTYPDLKGIGRPLFWKEENSDFMQEIVHHKDDKLNRRYGAGLLYPAGNKLEPVEDGDTLEKNGDDNQIDEISQQDVETFIPANNDDENSGGSSSASGLEQQDDDFDVASPDIYRPSTMGISFCIDGKHGSIKIAMPETHRFLWQPDHSDEFLVNGRYDTCKKIIKESKDGIEKIVELDAMRRFSATCAQSTIDIDIAILQHGKKISEKIPLPDGSPLSLTIEVFPRKINKQWIVTVVLRNTFDFNKNPPKNNNDKIKHVLFQSFFKVTLTGEVKFNQYPEGVRPFEQYDEDEKSLALLYRDSATWAIGHGCAAGWDGSLGDAPKIIYADVMPAVELPSMTPDIKDENGNPVSLSMRNLAELPAYDKNSLAWRSLENLSALYKAWIETQKSRLDSLGAFESIAKDHLEGCNACLMRINAGINLLKQDERARQAFCFANQAMLLQQIATKQLKRRELQWNGENVVAQAPVNPDLSNPWQIYQNKLEKGVGQWRAFQIAFLLMSLDGLVNESESNDRDIVDLIWFPTGGGKTEAYLAVAAFYMFHQRLLEVNDAQGSLPRDGTNVFMRYTLRMLTTQQFQRAASLITSMEFLREQPGNKLGATRFTLGLWIGGDGSPNSCEKAKSALSKFKRRQISGNPLVLTECPWCKSAIGQMSDRDELAGIFEINREPVLQCSDPDCHYGKCDKTLPIEVIDERLYRNPPSMFISTADKFAMMAYKPEAGAFFGRGLINSNEGERKQIKRPPGLILQDEFHLIAGPLGTIYGLYEGVVEALCSTEVNKKIIKPKIIASTATIRGAAAQVKSVYARDQIQLFPAPGLLMCDSFFGRYATEDVSEKLASGRLYLGVHAEGYGSFLTTQVRVFSAALFRASLFADDTKDAWWTLLAFYNSLRELGGARTLFTSDIASRLKHLSYRYGLEKSKQRYLNAVEELTSRKTQAELVTMMDKLTVEWNQRGSLDACLASNIIEVGVDIDRLSLMAITGQPKSTAQYIQVTGRVGRKWWERPGLILAMYNPAKSRDRSHFEQFQSYHRRLYERVEPTSATPFSVQTVARAMAGVLLFYARQFYETSVPANTFGYYEHHLKDCKELLIERCALMNLKPDENDRVITAIEHAYNELLYKWKLNPQLWERFPQQVGDEYLMLWPGQNATNTQKKKGVQVLSSMRNVDNSAEMSIVDWYI